MIEASWRQGTGRVAIWLESELARGLRAIFDGNIQQIILYGSAARKEDTPESDIDIAIILRQEISPDRRKEFLEWPAWLDMKYGKPVAISVIVLIFWH